MIADAVIYHPTISHYLKYISTTAGRDKVLRTIQYFSRFYAWYLYRTNALPATIAPFNAVKKQFGLARKLMRLGKNVEHFRAAAAAYDAKPASGLLSSSSSGFLRYCVVGRQLGYGGYLSFDALTYLDAAGIRPTPAAKRLNALASRCWLTGLLFSVVAGVYTLAGLREREMKLNKEIGEGVVETKRLQKERAAVNLQLISDLCDLTMPISALGYVNLDDGIVGLAGTVSSLIGVYGVWKKTA